MNLPELLYGYFLKGEREPKAQEEVTFAPSYLNTCKRQVYYKKTGTKPSNPIDSPAFLKMHFGTIQHDEIQRILSELGVLKSFEEHRQIEYNGLKFNYFYDGILEGDILMEIKTKYGAGMKFVEDYPDEDHLMQVVSYMEFENLDKGIVLYIGRDNGYMFQHEVEKIDGVYHINGVKSGVYVDWKLRMDKLPTLKKQIENRELPGRDFNIVLKNLDGIIKDNFQHQSKKYKSDWQCSYCAFKDLCWKEELKEIFNHKFFINGKFE